MQVLPKSRKSKIRLAILVSVLILPFAGYLLWSPGEVVKDGRHDQQTNGIWMSHRWLGDDRWFVEAGREGMIAQYRDPAYIDQALTDLKDKGILDLMPHLAPAEVGGSLPAVDAEQVERLLDITERNGQRVLPWIGGVFERDCHPALPHWREAFVQSIRELLERHPRLAGVHLNIEPWPSGDADLLRLMDEIKAGLPEGKLLSVAAYPPPTRWQPDMMVHWDEGYFREVAKRSDHLAVMMYDTAVPLEKFYVSLMSQWTEQVLYWSEGRPVLLGLPCYADEGVGYHDPEVEHIESALAGIHVGLKSSQIPSTYRGVALYSLWEIDSDEWSVYEERFMKQ